VANGNLNPSPKVVIPGPKVYLALKMARKVHGATGVGGHHVWPLT